MCGAGLPLPKGRGSTDEPGRTWSYPGGPVHPSARDSQQGADDGYALEQSGVDGKAMQPAECRLLRRDTMLFLLAAWLR